MLCLISQSVGRLSSLFQENQQPNCKTFEMICTMSLGTHKNENVSKVVLYDGISSLNGKRSQLGFENLVEKDLA